MYAGTYAEVLFSSLTLEGLFETFLLSLLMEITFIGLLIFSNIFWSVKSNGTFLMMPLREMREGGMKAIKSFSFNR